MDEKTFRQWCEESFKQQNLPKNHIKVIKQLIPERTWQNKKQLNFFEFIVIQVELTNKLLEKAGLDYYFELIYPGGKLTEIPS